MVRFVEWSNELSVGIEEIDAQHKVLVDLLNQIHEAIQQRHGAEITSEVTIPRQSRGLSFMSRSKRLIGVANAAPPSGTTYKGGSEGR